MSCGCSPSSFRRARATSSIAIQGTNGGRVQEGEVTFTVKGQAPRVLKAGEFVYVPRGTVHRNQNLSNAPARSIELNITDKDAPRTEPVVE